MSNHLNLGLRWLTHELANGLSALRSGLDMEEAPMTEAATSQLIGLVRAVQLIAAQGEVDSSHWQESLRAIATLRGIELEFHTDRVSFKQIQVLTSLFLTLIPRIITGKITITADGTKARLAASAVLPKAIEEIEKALSAPELEQASFIPLYLASAQGDVLLEKTEGGLALCI
jgi:hypothetical protein